MALIEWAVAAAAVVRVAWVYSGLILMICKVHGWRKPDFARWLLAELRPFYLPAVLICLTNVALKGQMLGWNALWYAIALGAWFLYKDLDEDDRWKRRRRKVAEKVTRIGGRLAVVPAESGTR